MAYLKYLQLLSVTLLLAAGCALSPQTVPVRPELTDPAARGNGKIFIQVADKRASGLMGYRGGVYETASISTATDITGAVHRELVQAMSAAGYAPVERQQQADLSLLVGIDKLTYSAQQRNVLWIIEINAAVSATVTRATVENSVQVQDRLTREFAKAPSEKENNQIINTVISKVLQRIVDNGSLFNP